MSTIPPIPCLHPGDCCSAGLFLWKSANSTSLIQVGTTNPAPLFHLYITLSPFQQNTLSFWMLPFLHQRAQSTCFQLLSMAPSFLHPLMTPSQGSGTRAVQEPALLPLHPGSWEYTRVLLCPAYVCMFSAGTRNRTQDLRHANQSPYHCATSPGTTESCP